jgi:hypothetical protein
MRLPAAWRIDAPGEPGVMGDDAVREQQDERARLESTRVGDPRGRIAWDARSNVT